MSYDNWKGREPDDIDDSTDDDEERQQWRARMDIPAGLTDSAALSKVVWPYGWGITRGNVGPES